MATNLIGLDTTQSQKTGECAQQLAGQLSSVLYEYSRLPLEYSR